MSNTTKTTNTTEKTEKSKQSEHDGASTGKLTRKADEAEFAHL